MQPSEAYHDLANDVFVCVSTIYFSKCFQSTKMSNAGWPKVGPTSVLSVVATLNLHSCLGLMTLHARILSWKTIILSWITNASIHWWSSWSSTNNQFPYSIQYSSFFWVSFSSTILRFTRPLNKLVTVLFFVSAKVMLSFFKQFFSRETHLSCEATNIVGIIQTTDRTILNWHKRWCCCNHRKVVFPESILFPTCPSKLAN